MRNVDFTQLFARARRIGAGLSLLIAASGCAREAVIVTAPPKAQAPLMPVRWVPNEAQSLAASESAVAHEDEGLDELGEHEDGEPEDARLDLEEERRPHPLAAKTAQEIDEMVRNDLESLGSMSFGAPTQGRLLNSIRLHESDRWHLNDPINAWGTEETVSYLATAVDAVRAEFPDTPKLHIGDISARYGGRLRPHVSHQGGEDVDVGYYYTKDVPWYTTATRSNLDLPRTWAFIRALLSKTDVRYIFIDTRIQRWLREYAESIGEDRDWLEGVFKGGPDGPAVIRHAPGHATHIHIRFYNPIATETARLCYRSLLRLGKLMPTRYYVQHKVKQGETLIGLAKRYRTTVEEIKRANGLRGDTIRANRSYKMPQIGSAGPARATELPPRRRPPRPPTGRIAAR